VSLTVDDRLVLHPDQYHGYTFTLGAGDSIVYGIQVITGSNIDVYFFTPTGLAAYLSHPPQTSQAVTNLTNRQQFGGTFSAATGAVTVIIDNVNGTGASATGDVEVQVGMTRSGGGPPPDFFSGILAVGLILCVGLIAIVVIVLFLIIFFVTHRDKRPMPPAAPAYMPPPQPPWPPQRPPPQGGAPPERYPPQNP